MTFAPSLIANDAQVWRRSCSRTPSHPSTARRRLGEGVARLAKRQVTAARGLEHQRAAIAAWLADPTDLAFNEDHLDDPDALAAAVDDLLARKPHLASRKPMGEIGQGATPSTATVDLAAILRRRAQ